MNDPRTVIFNMPLYIEVKTKTKGTKKYYINLNNYRNWHYQVSNKLKIHYKNLVQMQLSKNLKMERCRLEFTLFKGTRRRSDRANVLSISEKFFCDALVDSGVLKDDNDDYIQSTLYKSGEIDKENPRVEIKLIK
jgi:hypothetical protein